MSQQALIEQLVALVGETNVLTASVDMAPHLIDWRRRYRGAARCVVRPANTDEVSAVVRACAAAGVPIVPQGGNTSHCGASIPDPNGEAIVLSLSRMNRIRAIDVANNTITVDEDVILLKTIQCPNCGEMLEFDLDSIEYVEETPDKE